MRLLFVLFSLHLSVIAATCPYANLQERSLLYEPDGNPPMGAENKVRLDEYLEALDKIDFDEVRAAIVEVLTDSKNFWPADYGTYAGLFIRLAWHSAGTYRASDGRGGPDGARQRFEPEISWPDNTNLIKPKTLLWPIKERFGTGLSWGDLIVLAGDMSIKEAGGPILGFCAGRFDDVDGEASVLLGPNAYQKELFPCAPEDGLCENPLGQTTLGLIYVNPEGPLGVPDPAGSVPLTRSSFERMGMNDSETVALIGGGHTLGKTHGACPKGAGPGPEEDPQNPWPGLCGTGKGADAFTSGFEGPWVTTPTEWQNEYFHNLLNYEWEKYKGPGGLWQWRPKKGELAAEAAFGEGTQDVMMLTTDVGLVHDEEYKKLVHEFKRDLGSFNNAFGHAWYKLVTRDMGPYQRCRGDDVPPPQPFQYPLPLPDYGHLADFQLVAADLQDAMAASPEYGEAFARLAALCSTSFRATDYQGGCNGAFLRFEPQKSYPSNAGATETLAVLQPIKERFGDGLSWADLMVLAGTSAVVSAGGLPMQFCGGRTDASADQDRPELEPLWSFSGLQLTGAELKHFGATQVGLELAEFVAVLGYRSIGECTALVGNSECGYPRTATPGVLDNAYFKNILTLSYHKMGQGDWYRAAVPEAEGGYVYALTGDMWLLWDPELKAQAQKYAENNDHFLESFKYAWKRFNNLDRFWLDSPPGSACTTIG